MDLTLLRSKDAFPLYVLERLNRTPVDYLEKHLSIERSNAAGAKHLEAGVVLLMLFRDSEFNFLLIKRSDAVAQSGDISCPGGMLERPVDELLSHILLKTGILRTAGNQVLYELPNKDEETLSLVRLFLMNALRESWEEIGLSPLNVEFLGALPTYSLTLFTRTIFPLVCLVREPWPYRPNEEVDKVLEIPLGFFFRSSSYALLELRSESGNSDPRQNFQFPCLVIPDGKGGEDILWGATFFIITNFLSQVAGGSFPADTPARVVTKIIPLHYTSGTR
ncbi:MAG TPA: CoA pyrophosphatase [Smithellaceae bacterium]|nr:CoA pyrophosphatase [Smithellaceae bacterium]HRV43792.1 CoA pyrophosphatase [Smithellaceae bacterium]